jgi:hypothetical protein
MRCEISRCAMRCFCSLDFLQALIGCVGVNFWSFLGRNSVLGSKNGVKMV